MHGHVPSRAVGTQPGQTDAIAGWPEQELLEVFFGHAPIGLGLIDDELRYVRVNARLAAINGSAAADHLGRTVREVLPDAADMIEPLLHRALGGEPVLELSVDGPPDERGDVRRFRVSYVPLRRGAQGPVAGVAALVAEVTDRHAVESELRLAQGRLQLALEGTHTGTFEWDVASDHVRWSENLGPLWGERRGWQPVTYDGWLATVHPDDRAAMAAAVARSVETGEGYHREFRRLRPDGTILWAETKTHVVCDEAGRPVTLVGLVYDISERHRRERANRFLADASLELARSLDPGATLQRVADLAVPELGDWCSVLLDGPDRLRTIAVAHSDPAKVALAEELGRRYPADPAAPTGAPAVLRSGRPEIYPVIPQEMLDRSASDAEHLELLQRLDLRSAIVVPMTARGRTVGAMTFVFAESGREYGTWELELAEELGRRAGLAVDNGRLHQRARAAAEQLQRSLLPELPDVPGWSIAAAYRPGEDGTQVGGDWYDVFGLPDGRCAIVVGDVVGRGLDAAATMGQLRSWLRAHAVRCEDPADVLAELDATIEAIGGVSFATCAVALLDPATGAGAVASAGHVPPLLLAAGSPMFADAQAGAPLGAGGPARESAPLALEPGDTIVLYTDGLVERRDVPLEARLEMLRSALAAPAGHADELVGRALDEMLEHSEHPDDAVVLVVRRVR